MPLLMNKDDNHDDDDDDNHNSSQSSPSTAVAATTTSHNDLSMCDDIKTPPHTKTTWNKKNNKQHKSNNSDNNNNNSNTSRNRNTCFNRRRQLQNNNKNSQQQHQQSNRKGNKITAGSSLGISSTSHPNGQNSQNQRSTTNRNQKHHGSSNGGTTGGRYSKYHQPQRNKKNDLLDTLANQEQTRRHHDSTTTTHKTPFSSSNLSSIRNHLKNSSIFQSHFDHNHKYNQASTTSIRKRNRNRKSSSLNQIEDEFRNDKDYRFLKDSFTTTKNQNDDDYDNLSKVMNDISDGNQCENYNNNTMQNQNNTTRNRINNNRRHTSSSSGRYNSSTTKKSPTTTRARATYPSKQQAPFKNNEIVELLSSDDDDDDNNDDGDDNHDADDNENNIDNHYRSHYNDAMNNIHIQKEESNHENNHHHHKHRQRQRQESQQQRQQQRQQSQYPQDQNNINEKNENHMNNKDHHHHSRIKQDQNKSSTSSLPSSLSKNKSKDMNELLAETMRKIDQSDNYHSMSSSSTATSIDKTKKDECIIEIHDEEEDDDDVHRNQLRKIKLKKNNNHGDNDDDDYKNEDHYHDTKQKENNNDDNDNGYHQQKEATKRSHKQYQHQISTTTTSSSSILYHNSQDSVTSLATQEENNDMINDVTEQYEKLDVSLNSDDDDHHCIEVEPMDVDKRSSDKEDENDDDHDHDHNELKNTITNNSTTTTTTSSSTAPITSTSQSSSTSLSISTTTSIAATNASNTATTKADIHYHKHENENQIKSSSSLSSKTSPHCSKKSKVSTSIPINNAIDLSTCDDDNDDGDNNDDNDLSYKKKTKKQLSPKKLSFTKVNNNNNNDDDCNDQSSNNSDNKNNHYQTTPTRTSSNSRLHRTPTTPTSCNSNSNSNNVRKKRINNEIEGGVFANLCEVDDTKKSPGSTNSSSSSSSSSSTSRSISGKPKDAPAQKKRRKKKITFEESSSSSDDDENMPLCALKDTTKNDYSQEKESSTIQLSCGTPTCDEAFSYSISTTPHGSPPKGEEISQSRMTSKTKTTSPLQKLKDVFVGTAKNLFRGREKLKRQREDDITDNDSSDENQQKKRKKNSDEAFIDKSFSADFPTLSHRRQTRSQTKKKSKHTCFIDDISSESEFEDVYIADEEKIQLAKTLSISAHETQKKKVGKRLKIDVNRIAMGRKVYSANCSLSFQSGRVTQYLFLEYSNNNGTKQQVDVSIESSKTQKHEIDVVSDIKELNYYYPPQDQASQTTASDDLISRTMLVLNVEKNSRNQLDSLRNVYKPEAKSGKTKYLVIEFNETQQLQNLIEKMRSNEILRGFIDSGGQVSVDNINEYIQAFVNNDKKAGKKSLFDSYLRPVKQEEILLNFPFNVTYAELEQIASGLSVANGSLSQSSDATGDPSNPTKQEKNLDEKFINVWKHSHTVRGEDYERLHPGEYLNDVLIDLWMTWILRKEDESSNIHFFSTQFFQKIQDQGVESVEGWTRRRKINIFEKKFIFIPINDYLHWSLCVVVNPGKIENASIQGNDENEDLETEDNVRDLPFLLFLDSLKAHKKAKVKKKIYEWLNSEAKRLNKFSHLFQSKPPKTAFWNRSMPMLDPLIPYQNNGWDCGVFVCRYAFGVLSLRNVEFRVDSTLHFKKREAAMKKLLENKITDSDEFDFDMNDIERLRRNFAKLIDRLSDLYKKKEEETIRKKKKLKKQNKMEGQSNLQFVKSNKTNAISENTVDDHAIQPKDSTNPNSGGHFV